MRPPRLALASAAALAAVLVTGTAVAVTPPPSSLQAADRAADRALAPTSLARAHGITAPGEAHMGWSQPKAARGAVSPTQAAPAAKGPQLRGIDVSSHQGNVNWPAQWAADRKFAYVKATEGTSYRNPYFGQQYSGSYNVGMIRGAYHFALPSNSSGTAQANHFVANGGGWSRDGRTLPGVLDVEYNPYGETCYGKSPASMRAWIRDFTLRYKSLTGRDAVIYSTTDWWTRCTGNTSYFSGTNPLWIARYSSSAGTLPSGWAYYTFWQYTSSPIDQNYFNGDGPRLRALANG